LTFSWGEECNLGEGGWQVCLIIALESHNKERRQFIHSGKTKKLAQELAAAKGMEWASSALRRNENPFA